MPSISIKFVTFFLVYASTPPETVVFSIFEVLWNRHPVRDMAIISIAASGGFRGGGGGMPPILFAAGCNANAEKTGVGDCGPRYRFAHCGFGFATCVGAATAAPSVGAANGPISTQPLAAHCCGSFVL